MPGSPSRVVIVGFDGLRPDLVRRELMPNLYEFHERAAVLERHQAVFPTETMVNFASFVTGTYPDKHGITANQLVRRRRDGLSVLSTSSVADIELADRQFERGLYEVPTVAKMLADNKRRMAVVSTGSAGATRMLCHHQHPGHLSFSTQSTADAFPDAFVRHALTRHGAPPPKGIPDGNAVRYATTVFLDTVLEAEPCSLSILWFNDPDYSSHKTGVASSETVEGLRICDQQFSRVFDWWASVCKDENVLLATMSDHGHVAAAGYADLESELQGVLHPQDRLLDGRLSQLFLHADVKGQRLRSVLEVLHDIDSIECLITRPSVTSAVDLPKVRSNRSFRCDHPRAPDVYICMAGDLSKDIYGLPGTAYKGRHGPRGQGMHGGGHPMEHHCVFSLAGRGIRPQTIDRTTGIVDLAPTILTLLGLSCPATVQGRVIHELAETRAAV